MSVGFISIGSARESYLRYAQTLGLASVASWVIRPLSPVALGELADSSGALAYLKTSPVRAIGDLKWQTVPVTASVWYNTTYPFGWNDGAVWRGRGATGAIEGGVDLRWRFLSATLDPMAFIAENRAFPFKTFSADANPFADPITPYIDRPQRFGDKSYGQITPGQSTVRLDGLGVSAGVSTANMWIGPMGEWPFLLSNNAAGFPHVFAGSSSPWNIGIGRIHGRIVYGGLTQSAFTNEPDTAPGRIISGIFGSFSPRFLPGLEIGFGRVFEYRWPPRGFSSRDFRKPFEAFLKEKVNSDETAVLGAQNQSSDNQLASVFARWVMPHSGFEVYGEFGRDDHNWNGRDAILEPDHIATYGLGLRKAWLNASGRLTGVRAEILNMEQSTLARARPQGSFYEHTATKQGHTQMGQVLGAGFAATSAAGSLLAIDRFTPSGESSSYSLTRMVTRESDFAPRPEVEYALALERTRSTGGFHLTYGLTAVYDFNRDFSADVGNVMTTLRVRW